MQLKGQQVIEIIEHLQQRNILFYYMLAIAPINITVALCYDTN